jgi:hypothetical protein
MAVSDKSLSHINRNTLVPLGISVGILVAAVGTAWGLRGKMEEFVHEVRDLKSAVNRLSEVTEDLRLEIRDSVRRRDMETWIRQMAELNEGRLKVPEFPK